LQSSVTRILEIDHDLNLEMHAPDGERCHDSGYAKGNEEILLALLAQLVAPGK
jgi:hypothetical protein